MAISTFMVATTIIGCHILIMINYTIIASNSIIFTVEFWVRVTFIIMTKHSTSFVTVNHTITIGIYSFKRWATILVAIFKARFTQIIGTIPITICIVSTATIRARVCSGIGHVWITGVIPCVLCDNHG